MMHSTRHANCGPFGDYSSYVSELKRLADSPQCSVDWDSRAVAALNGQASIELRRLASVEIRREFGAFFTGTELSSLLLAHCGATDTESVFYDPTCGMGDLLLAAAKRLPLCANISATLRQWGKQLSGTDIHREFIEGAKSRLVLYARQRHATDESLDLSCAEFFPYLRVADGLKQYALFERATHLLLNPPFGTDQTPAGCTWAGGRMTASAQFVVTALERAKPDVEMLAILPDVLRSGSFAAKWRSRVSDLAQVCLVKPYGVFDASADVDVFLARLIRRACERRRTRTQWPRMTSVRTTTVTDYFDVHVGPVVPHRDRKVGPRHVYIHPRCVPVWRVMRSFSETRKHAGHAYSPPFVVIRRTSRPGDVYRATATVIAGKAPVAVENHLIVCEPRDGKLATCQKLMRQLRTEMVNEYLNERIRCRHLTVDAVAAIPYTPT